MQFRPLFGVGLGLTVSVWLFASVVAPPPLDTDLFDELKRAFFNAFSEGKYWAPLVRDVHYRESPGPEWRRMTTFPVRYIVLLHREEPSHPQDLYLPRRTIGAGLALPNGAAPETTRQVVYAFDRIPAQSYRSVQIPGGQDPGPFVYRIWKLDNPTQGNIRHELVALANIPDGGQVFKMSHLKVTRPPKLQKIGLNSLDKYWFASQRKEKGDSVAWVPYRAYAEVTDQVRGS